jgi:hypothetical protein
VTMFVHKLVGCLLLVVGCFNITKTRTGTRAIKTKNRKKQPCGSKFSDLGILMFMHKLYYLVVVPVFLVDVFCPANCG